MQTLGIIEGIINASNQKASKGKGKIKILTQLQKKILNQSNKSRENSLEDSKVQFYGNKTLLNDQRHVRNNSDFRTKEDMLINPTETIGSTPKKKMFLRLDKIWRPDESGKVEGNPNSFSFYKVNTPSME